MAHQSHRLHRLAARAEALDAGGEVAHAAPRAAVGAVLVGLWRVSGAAAVVLAGLALGAPGWVGDGRAAWLSGAPAVVVGGAFLAGRRMERRRVAMVVATAATGYLGLAALPGAVAIGTGRAGAQYSLACAIVCAVHLGVGWFAWRRANEVGRAAEAWAALREEL